MGDVITMDNKFQNPSCMGLRSVTFVVRSWIEERAHLSELIFSFHELESFARKDGLAYRDDMAHILRSSETLPKECRVEIIVQIALWVLELTPGRASRWQERQCALLGDVDSGVEYHRFRSEAIDVIARCVAKLFE